jgi:hypothetical protein
MYYYSHPGYPHIRIVSKERLTPHNDSYLVGIKKKVFVQIEKPVSRYGQVPEDMCHIQATTDEIIQEIAMDALRQNMIPEYPFTSRHIIY